MKSREPRSPGAVPEPQPVRWAFDRVTVDRKVRVLFSEVTAGRGGSAVGLVRLAPGLATRGVLPMILVYQMSPRIERLREMGIAVRDLGLKGTVPPDVLIHLARLPVPTLSFIHICQEAVRTMMKWKAEIVYLNTTPYGQLPVLLAARWLRRPVICHLRETLTLTRLERVAIRHIDAFIATSDAAVEHYVWQGVPLERVARVYGAVDLAEFDARARLEPAVHDGAYFTLGLVGSLIPRKGHMVLFEAVRQVLPSVPNVRVFCVGGGPLRRQLEDMVRELGIAGAVSFLGYSSNVPGFLRSIDACVVPSSQEGIPQVIREAMAAGRPVIASDLIGMREVVRNGETGILVPPGDAAALAGAVRELAAHPSRARAMGKRGRDALEAGHFSPDSEAEQVMAVVARVVGLHPGAKPRSDGDFL